MCALYRYDLSLGNMSAALHQANHNHNHMPAMGGGYLGLGQGLNLGAADDLTRQPMAALMQRLGFWPQPQQQAQAQQQQQALHGLGHGHSMGMHANPSALAHADLQLKADALQQQQQQHAAEEEATAMRRQLHHQQLQQYHAALEQQAAIQQQLQVRCLGSWPATGTTVGEHSTKVQLQPRRGALQSSICACGDCAVAGCSCAASCGCKLHHSSCSCCCAMWPPVQQQCKPGSLQKVVSILNAAAAAPAAYAGTPCCLTACLSTAATTTLCKFVRRWVACRGSLVVFLQGQPAVTSHMVACSLTSAHLQRSLHCSCRASSCSRRPPQLACLTYLLALHRPRCWRPARP